MERVFDKPFVEKLCANYKKGNGHHVIELGIRDEKHRASTREIAKSYGLWSCDLRCKHGAWGVAISNEPCSDQLKIYKCDEYHSGVFKP